ncbi:MAG: pilus assembly protein PilM [Candidatus Omnitrophica bacterium]|nr:pilus assembly protein PilM [Candidatus Omnitrophota bacterium]
MKIDIAKLLQKKEQVTTVFQIDNNWLRLIQAKAVKREKRVSMIKAMDISSLSDEEIALKVSSLAVELKINSRHLILAIPRHLTTTRNLDLPSANPAEIKDMIELQIGKQTPYASDEVIKDYQILGSNADGYSKVLLVIVHRDIVGRYFKILEAAGLKAQKVSFSSEGLLNWMSLAYRQKLAAEKAHILIEVDYDASDFEVVLNDKMVFGRSISLGFSQLPGQLEQWQKKFIEEVNHSIYAYQNEIIGKEIDKIIISRPRLVGDSLDKAVLEKELGASVEIIDQFKDIPLTEEGASSYNNLIRTDLSYAGLLGLALPAGEHKIDLVPQEHQIGKAVKEKGKDLYLMGILLVFILVAFSGVFLGRMYNKERYLGQLKQRLAAIQNKTKELNSMIRGIETIKDRVYTRGMSLNLIYEVHRAILPEMHLVSISFDGKEELVLRGQSNEMSEVFNFVNKLEESSYFQNVKSKYATKRKVGDKEITDFEISCPLADKYKISDKHKL